jgi:glycosyltransferase involved in cell wall biosynthesis
VGGTSEALDHGRVGALVPPDDPSALANALAVELARGRDAQRIRAARQHVLTHHDLTTNLKRITDLWPPARS